MGDCYNCIRNLKTPITKAIEEGIPQMFSYYAGILSHNIQRFEELGDLRPSNQINDSDIIFLTQVNHEKEKIFSLLPVYEKANYFAKETRFLNDSFKRDINNYQNANISEGTINNYKRNILKAMKFGDDNFSELNFLNEKTREKIVEDYKYLKEVSQNFDEIYDFVKAHNEVSSIVSSIKNTYERMKSNVDNKKYNEIIRSFNDFIKARNDMMTKPRFKKCKEIEPLKTLCNEVEELYQKLINGLYHESEVEDEKENVIKTLRNELESYKRNNKYNEYQINSFYNKYVIIQFEEVKNDPEIINMKNEFEEIVEKTYQDLRYEKMDYIKRQCLSLLNSLDAVNDKNKIRLQEEYALQKCMLFNDQFIADFTEECPEISKKYEEYQQKYGKEITPIYNDYNVRQIFSSFIKNASNIRTNINNSNLIQFKKYINICEFIINKSDFQNYLSESQKNDKDYIQITNIIANKDKFLELVPYYSRYSQFQNNLFTVKEALQKLQENKFSYYQYFEAKPRIEKTFNFYSEKFYELEFLSDNEKNLVQTFGPLIVNYHEKSKETLQLLLCQYISQQLESQFNSKYLKMKRALESKSYNFLNELEDYILMIEDLSNRTYIQEASSIEPLKSLVKQITETNEYINTQNILTKYQIDEAFRTYENTLNNYISRIQNDFSESTMESFYTTISQMKANCANILQEQKFQDMVTKFETYLKESLQKQREKELKSAEEQAFNELKQYSKENMSENDKKYFLERYIKFSNKSIKGVITNVTVNEKCIPLIENYLSNGGTLYETKSSSKAPFDYDIWVPSQMPENLIQCDIRPVPCLPGAIQTEFKPPELVKKTFAPPTIGSVAVQFNVPKIQPKPTQVKQEAPKPVQVKQEVQTQQIQPKPAQVQPKPTQETPKPVQSQEKSNGPSELQIILVFNAIKNTQLNKLVLNGNLSGFKQEIKKIEQQLSIIDMFSSQEYLNSTQANDKDFLLIKEIYENHSQIEEIIPRYEKFQRFSNGIYFIQSDKDLIQKIISNPEDIQTSIYSLERMKTNVTNLMKFNDKFDDLKYCPTEQLEKILECQKIATILNDKIDDIITHEKQKEVASRVKASYNTQLRYYQEEIDSQNYERKIRYYEDLLKAKDEIYNKYKEYVNVNPLKQFLDDIETLIKKTKDEKIIENAKIKTESEKFLIRYRPLIERLQREQSPSQSLNNDLSQLEESFRRQNPSIFEVEEVKDLIQKKEQIQEKQNGYKMQQQINAEAFQTSKQLNEIIPKEFENWEIEKFNELLEKRKHIIIEGKEVDTTQTPKVQEILDNFKEKQQQCYLLKLIQYYEITHPDRSEENLMNHRYLTYKEIDIDTKIGFLNNLTKYNQDKDNILQSAYVTGKIKNGTMNKLQNRFQKIIDTFKNEKLPGLKKEFNYYVKRASENIIYYNGCEEIIGIVKIFLEEESKEMQQILDAIKKPEQNQYKLQLKQHIGIEQDYKNAIEDSIKNIKIYYQTMKKDTKPINSNYFKLISLINGIFVATQNIQAYECYYKEIKEFFESIKEEIKTEIQPILIKHLEKAKVIISAINSPPKIPSSRSSNWSYFEKYNAKTLMTTILSYYISNISLIQIVLGIKIDELEELIQMSKENTILNINEDQLKIIEESESYLETNPILSMKIIEGLWNFYSANENIYERCYQILQKTYEKLGRIPLNDFIPTTYIYSKRSQLNTMLFEPFFDCDCFIYDKDLNNHFFIDLSTYKFFKSASAKITDSLMSINDLKHEILTNETGVIHPAFRNTFFLQEEQRKINDKFNPITKAFIQKMTKLTQIQIKRCMSEENIDLLRKQVELSEFRGFYNYESFSTESIFKFICNFAPIINDSFSQAVQNFQNTFNKLPKRRSPIDKANEIKFESLKFQFDKILPLKCILTDVIKCKEVEWVNLLEFGSIYIQFISQCDTFIRYIYTSKILTKYYDNIKSFFIQQHAILLETVREFHIKYSSKVVSNEDAKFIINLRDYQGVNREIVQKIYYTVISYVHTLHDNLEKQAQKMFDEMRKLSNERRQFLQAKYIDPIKDDTVIEMYGKKYVSKRTNDYVRFAAPNDSFIIYASTSEFNACSIVVKYDKGTYNLETHFFPYVALRQNFDPIHYQYFKDQNCTSNCTKNFTRYYTYTITDCDNTTGCVNGGIDESIFRAIVVTYNCLDDYEAQNDAERKRLKRQMKRLEEEREREKLRQMLSKFR